MSYGAKIVGKNSPEVYFHGLKTFGQNLKALRKARGLKAKDIAVRLDAAPSVISGWENDRRGLPETPTLFKLAKVLECSIDDLLEDVDPDYQEMRKRLTDEINLARHHGAVATVAVLEKIASDRGLMFGNKPSQDADPLDHDVTDYKREDIPVIQEGDASPTGGLSWDADPQTAGEVERTSRPYDFRERGAYAIVLRGDSMEPLLKRGMRLIMSVTKPIGDGDLVYVQLKSGERLVKIATRMTDAWLLTSANPAHPPRPVRVDEIEHIHKVAYVRFLK